MFSIDASRVTANSRDTGKFNSTEHPARFSSATIIKRTGSIEESRNLQPRKHCKRQFVTACNCGVIITRWRFKVHLYYAHEPSRMKPPSKQCFIIALFPGYIDHCNERSRAFNVSTYLSFSTEDLAAIAVASEEENRTKRRRKNTRVLWFHAFNFCRKSSKYIVPIILNRSLFYQKILIKRIICFE